MLELGAYAPRASAHRAGAAPPEASWRLSGAEALPQRRVLVARGTSPCACAGRHASTAAATSAGAGCMLDACSKRRKYIENNGEKYCVCVLHVRRIILPMITI